MSKAFTKDHDGFAPPPLQKRGIAVPEPNYVTPAGARAARAELEQLTRSAGDPDASASEIVSIEYPVTS